MHVEINTLKDLVNIDKTDLLAVLQEYSDYVVEFNETHDQGSNPVSLLEFYNNDYQVMTDNMYGFVNDLDKMIDFMVLSKEEFLNSYSYLTDFDYEITKRMFEENKAERLADMMREAENIYLDEMNGRSDRIPNFQYMSDEIKTTIMNYVNANLNDSEREEFVDCCEAMAI